MYKNLLSKMQNHFSKDGLIMYSKYNDYYKINPISFTDIKMFYALLISNEPLDVYIRKPSHIACCLYYLSKESQEYKKIMYEKIILKLKKNDEINDTNLFLIYNIIDYIEKYLNLGTDLLTILLTYLERFSAHKKTVENYLLYKYYRGILLLRLNHFDEANSEYLEIVMALAEEVNIMTDYLEFIKLKNNLFNLRLSKNVQLNEQYELLKNLFEHVKSQDKLLAIKLGFGLYQNLYEQNKFNDCILILDAMKTILKKALMSGIEIKNGIDLYLAISSRLGFIGVLINNQNAINNAIKKIDKSLKIIENDKEDKKLKILYKSYSFVNTILKINNSIYTEQPSAKAFVFKSEFKPHNIEEDNSNNFIITNENKYKCIINLYGINNMDINISNNSEKLLSSILNDLKNKHPLQHSMAMIFIVGIQNKIYHLSESYCTDKNKNSQQDYLTKIIDNSSKVLNYVKSNYEHNESILRTEFVKRAIIKIFFCSTQMLIYTKNFGNVRDSIIEFEKICQILRINNTTPFYELILKIKGDYWFYTKRYDEAIECYSNANKLMGNDNPKKPIIYFNIGSSYYSKGVINLAIKNFYKCITCFNNIEQCKRTFDFYDKTLKKKVELAQKILKLIEE